MNVRIGIMGFGRIGRNIFRIVYPRTDIEVTAIVDVAHPKSLEYLLKFDTVHGRFREPVSVIGDAMYVKGHQVQMITAAEPGVGVTPNHFSLIRDIVPSSFMHSMAFSTLLRRATLSLRKGIEKTRPVE